MTNHPAATGLNKDLPAHLGQDRHGLYGNLQPITLHNSSSYSPPAFCRPATDSTPQRVYFSHHLSSTRSEERRVGKECRYRRATWQEEEESHGWRACRAG